MLPAPCSERWKPLRAGLVDMFYYDAEEFWFHDGRLLLRGNNGTGKSKVLALTLPFLLDGELMRVRQFVAVAAKNLDAIVIPGIVGCGDDDSGRKFVFARQVGDGWSSDDACTFCGCATAD